MIKNEAERLRMGERIAALRKSLGMTQTELAERTGLQRSHIVRLEQGRYGATIDVLSAIADALNCKIDFINKYPTIMEPQNITAENLFYAIVNMGGDPYVIEDEEQAAQVAESINNATSMRELEGEELATAREQLDCPGAERVFSFVDGSEFLVCFSEDWYYQK